MTKIILDTDIGTDIDDAFALAYLLANPDCELLGITTVSGEPVKRAMLASVFCKIAGKNIPIFPGLSKPLVIKQIQKQAEQAKKIANWSHEINFPKNKAISFLNKTIRENPGEIVLLTIGPLTNIATLFKTDPEIAGLLKGVVTMCGRFNEDLKSKESWGKVEWNAHLDPEAAAIVYQTNLPNHKTVSLDVTTQLTMDAKEAKDRCSHKLLQPVLDFSEVWFEKRDTITFHDPLAAAVIFNENICSYEKGNIEVELADNKLKGQTRFVSNKKNSIHKVAFEVNAQNFKEEFFKVFIQ